MMTYYKAVRPDGTDFHSGTVRWLPAKRSAKMRPRIVRHPSSALAVKGEHSTSLAVSTDPTRLPGSSWPLRLCEVEPVWGAPVIETDKHKRQAVAWRVTREVDPWMRFGPQGEPVVALIERLRATTAAEVRELAAWAAARDAAAWAAARGAARAAAWAAARDAAWDAARAADWDAARGLVTRDLIGTAGYTQAHYDLLTSPVRQVLGRIHPDDTEADR